MKRNSRAMQTSGCLAPLPSAWSRDGDKEFYVQDCMLVSAAKFWGCFEEGGDIYVCGDAERMAKDVERALIDIACGTRRALDRRGRQLCRRAEEGRPLPGGCLLIRQRGDISAATFLPIDTQRSPRS